MREGRSRKGSHRWQQSRRRPEKQQYFVSINKQTTDCIHLNPEYENGLEDIAEREHCTKDQASKVGHLSIKIRKLEEDVDCRIRTEH